MSLNAVAILCEDVRQEIDGQFTIVGTFTDNLVVPHAPGILPKLAIFVRISMSVDHPAQDVEVYLRQGDLKSSIGEFEKDYVAKTMSDAKDMGNPLAGLILTAVASPYRLETPGIHWVELRYGAEVSTIGALRFLVPEPTGVDVTA